MLRIKMSEKKHRNVIIIFGILHAVVSEMLSYAGILLIVESVEIINFLQVMENGQFIHDIQTFLTLFDSSKYFFTLNTLAMVATMLNIVIRLIFKQTDYWGLRFFAILMCYQIAVFYGYNNSSMNLCAIVCVLFGLYVLKVISECLYVTDCRKGGTVR